MCQEKRFCENVAEIVFSFTCKFFILPILFWMNVFPIRQTNVCIQENQQNHILHFKSKAEQIGCWQHIFLRTANVLIYKPKYMETKDMIDNEYKRSDTIELFILALAFS